MFNTARLLSHVLTVLCLSPVHPPGPVLEARLTALKVADTLSRNAWINGQWPDERSPFEKYAECYVDDDETAGTVSTVVPLAHDPRSQCPLSSLVKHDLVCYEKPAPEIIPLVHDPRSQCPLSSLTRRDLACYEQPAPEFVPLVHDPSSQSPISSLIQSNLLCYDPPDPDGVPPVSHHICLSTDRADYIEDDEVEMCSIPPYFYDSSVNGSSTADLLTSLTGSTTQYTFGHWTTDGMAERGDRYTLFAETAVNGGTGGMYGLLDLGLIMLVIASFFSFSNFNMVFVFVYILDCATRAYRESLLYFASYADDPSTNAGCSDLFSIGDYERTLFNRFLQGHILPSVFEPSITNSSAPSTESERPYGTSTFSTTTFDVSYFDGTKRIIATVVLGSASGSKMFELLGIFTKSEATFGSACGSAFESESDIDVDDSSTQSQSDVHDNTSNALVLAPKKESPGSLPEVTELIETRRMDHFVTALIGETNMHWNPAHRFMSSFTAALETPALVHRPLAIRPRRKTPRGSRGKGGKAKKGKKVAVCPIDVSSEPEASIAPSIADSSSSGECAGSLSLSMYERPLGNSSLPSLISDTSDASTASTVSLIAIDSSYSAGIEVEAPDVHDGASTSITRSSVSAIQNDRPSLKKKITDFVQGYRTGNSTDETRPSTVTATLEELSEVTLPRKRSHRGTRHRGKGGKGKKAAVNPAVDDALSEPMTQSAADPVPATASTSASPSTGIASSARPVRPLFGSLFAKTVSSSARSSARRRQPSL
ncbi:hypothetical protein EW145_g7719 [Phellinidium pouzarii]|uniref:FAS1 domain-containing protein n=1 Tax=Phellinidium pouzarii TaxID=167371 RepID=A0A4S4KGW3_9AGAM|nr:hypothetical protein EW145_g7719 [Phellinidium pouzarii]